MDSSDSLKKIIINPNSRYLYNSGEIIINAISKAIVCSPKILCNTDITIFEDNTVISKCAFAESNITSVNFPNSAVSIKARAFYGCKELKLMFLNDNIELDGYSIFEHSGIEYVRLPQHIEIIPNSFISYSPLKQISIPPSVKKIEDRAFQGTLLDSLILPESIIALGENAFSRCKKLSSVILNEGLKIISDGCFSECVLLRKITIPSSVKTIGSNCFSLCPNISEIHCKNPKPDKSYLQGLSTFWFYGVKPTLYVPKGSLRYYLCNGISNYLTVIEE